MKKILWKTNKGKILEKLEKRLVKKLIWKSFEKIKEIKHVSQLL